MCDKNLNKHFFVTISDATYFFLEDKKINVAEKPQKLNGLDLNFLSPSVVFLSSAVAPAADDEITLNLEFDLDWIQPNQF